MKDPTIPNDSGTTSSTWMSERVPSFDAEIADGEHPDICVIGAGIAGLSVALSLVREGFDVLVVDQGPIGGGQTARTTAHLASALDDYFYVLEKRFGKKGAKLCYESHAAGIDEIENNVKLYGIACDFSRVDGYLFAGRDQDRVLLEKELDAAKRAGLVVEQIARAPLPFDTGPCLRFGNQAEIHPVKYLRGIARAIVEQGGRIRTGVHVSDVKSGRPVELTLGSGKTLRANTLVDATQMSITSRINMPTREAAYRTYILAFEMPHEYLPHALFWDTLDPYHYLRIAPGDGGEVLLVGGEDHRVGHGDPEVHFPRLEAWARERFPDLGATVAHWSGQVQEPSDGMAYIGRLLGHPNVFVVSGDSGNGITHGAVAGLMMPSLILHRQHPWRSIYAPNRSRMKALGAFAKEQMRSNEAYVDWMRGGDVDSLDDIRPGHGATIRRGLHVIAAYKDEKGQCHLMNANCPHLHGVVHWNEVEKTWDCPVHGSRFDCTGRVLNGPATSDLGEAPGDIEAPRQIPEPVLGDEAYQLKPA